MSVQSEKINFSSAEFLKSLQSRENSSVEKLVKKYTKQLVNAAYGLGFNESDGAELVQSVWFTFFEKLPTFEGRSHVRTYIYGILYNKAKELKRDRHKYTSEDPFDELMADKFDNFGHWLKMPLSPEKFLASAQSLEIIEKCLEVLPLQQKMAFQCKEIEGNTSVEICKILGITSTNLGVILYRAKIKLRDCIERKSQ